jgi:beta-lactamase class D
MFVWAIFHLVLVLTSCTTGEKPAAAGQNHKEKKLVKIGEFQGILDSSNVTGTILIYDHLNNIYYSNDFERCSLGHLPASTFKIPNSIIALETGVVEDDSTLFRWDGQKRRLSIWEQDLIFRDAFHKSCVPCYQEIARKIGAQRMQEYLSKLDYGEMVVDSATIDVFWLEGHSKISPFQQVDFLQRFYNSKLPISSRTEDIMKKLMVIEENEDYKLSGKTGWSVRNGNNNGWFVGYLEKRPDVYFFATNIDPSTEFNMDLFPMIRKDITLAALFRLLIN